MLKRSGSLASSSSREGGNRRFDLVVALIYDLDRVCIMRVFFLFFLKNDYIIITLIFSNQKPSTEPMYIKFLNYRSSHAYR